MTDHPFRLMGMCLVVSTAIAVVGSDSGPGRW